MRKLTARGLASLSESLRGDPNLADELASNNCCSSFSLGGKALLKSKVVDADVAHSNTVMFAHSGRYVPSHVAVCR